MINFDKKRPPCSRYGIMIMAEYLGLELGYLGFSKDLQMHMLEKRQQVGLSSKNHVP
jgi:hypothetical protein